MVTRKPPTGLAGAPYLVENGISMEGLTSALCVFSRARPATPPRLSPPTLVAALSLAGMAPSHDDRNLGRSGGDAELSSDQGRSRLRPPSTMSIENVPSENPKTGRITALSVIAALRKLTSPLQVGT